MAPRSTSVQPSQALPTTRVTRSRRGTSTVPASATSISSSTGNRIQKAVKAPSVSSVARTRRAASVVSTVSASSPTSAKPIQKPVAPVSAVPPARSGYGDAHADREYLGMLLYAKAVRKAGVVDEEMLEKMCKPWQEKGVLKIQWKEEYLLPGVKEAEEMMDVKKAEQINTLGEGRRSRRRKIRSKR
ncbi:hypothetical protein K458DRAFT_402443 [Lentithecium fluviatile CBS 122367]|uniref:Uncharacterized protein n=1 Tax=Lentithecium fluviatile CBS 122367 TaxID=1168545 RepID=A0A6G1J8M9_9PLEO|nr:hypothetical protein K458DRAFT_402443 [Lentithecium fluviatile CBS 122367]